MDLEAVSDWIAIHQLVSSYCHTIDNREEDSFLKLWHPEASWDLGEPLGTHRGLAEIRALVVEKAWPHRAATYYLATDIVIDLIDSDHATGRSVAYVQPVDHDGTWLPSVIARYQDEYVLYEGRWVFRSRTVVTGVRAASPTPASEI